jgi:hypothetical protein
MVTKTSDVFCQKKSSQKPFGRLNLNITRICLKWLSINASRRNFARRNKTVLGPRGQAETSLEIEDLRYIYPIQPLVYFH